jgi:hypothetical protein
MVAWCHVENSPCLRTSPNMGGTGTASIMFGIYHLNSLLTFIVFDCVKHSIFISRTFSLSIDFREKNSPKTNQKGGGSRSSPFFFLLLAHTLLFSFWFFFFFFFFCKCSLIRLAILISLLYIRIFTSV